MLQRFAMVRGTGEALQNMADPATSWISQRSRRFDDSGDRLKIFRWLRIQKTGNDRGKYKEERQADQDRSQERSTHKRCLDRCVGDVSPKHLRLQLSAVGNTNDRDNRTSSVESL